MTVAGSDPSGGAGIQADMKTAAAFGLYSMSVITALTVQNTTGVKSVHPVSENVVKEQLRAVLGDIFPNCIKIGMCANSEIISVIAEAIRLYKPRNIVLDTVLISSSGHRLVDLSAEDIMCRELFPLVDIITPNVPEAEHLSGCTIKDEKDMECAAKLLYDKYGCSVMLKGGHLNGCDMFYDGTIYRFKHELIDNKNIHGTGCTLSSAMACILGSGGSEIQAALGAVKYVHGAIKDGMDLGNGNGPLNHLYDINKFFKWY